MEAQPRTGSSSSSVANPRWVMLEQCMEIKVEKSSSCSRTDDAKSLAAARTTLGHLIQCSLHLEESQLAASRVCIQAPDGADEVEYTYMVVAAHGGSLLILVEEADDEYSATDYFVYNAGDAAAEPPRPPSLSLLPPCQEEDEDGPVSDHLRAGATGLLCRGEDELVVAELRAVKNVVDTTTGAEVAELCLFRSGEWSIMRLPISNGDDTGGVCPLPSAWFMWHTVGPVGDRQLCWVDFPRDVLVICDDVFEESPRLRYLRLPMDPYFDRRSDWNRNVCATAGGGGTLKFVNIFPRCCCGGAGASYCRRSRHAYTIHTWTLRMDDGGMEWVKDGIVDSSELWALDAYKGLPRVPLDHPVMSMDEREPHVVYFQLCESHHVKHGGDRKLWLLKVDTRSKTIQSVSRRGDGFSYKLHHMKLQFFNSYPSNASDGGALTGQRQMMGVERQQPAVVVVDDEQLVREDDDDASNPSSPFAEPSEQSSEFLEAFLEISRYGLGGDELEAYRILSHDNGRRFRALLRLPKNLRKDWLLMEIKASQAY